MTYIWVHLVRESRDLFRWDYLFFSCIKLIYSGTGLRSDWESGVQGTDFVKIHFRRAVRIQDLKHILLFSLFWNGGSTYILKRR